MYSPTLLIIVNLWDKIINPKLKYRNKFYKMFNIVVMYSDVTFGLQLLKVRDCVKVVCARSGGIVDSPPPDGIPT